jgi:quinoprotein glucose dehydrogenase
VFEQNQMRIGPIYTPFGLEGNVLMFPSTLGGGGWGGISWDPSLGLLFTNVNNLGQWGHMEKGADRTTGAVTYRRTSAFGTYARFWNPETRIPCSPPPFGELVAVNTSTGDIAWRTPLGTVPALEERGLRNTGALNLGGSIATAGGLVFIAATNDSRLRAFESKTGRLLWEQAIPANGHTIPITYLGKNGKQYVALMAGNGGGYFGGTPSDTVVAFALGDGPAPLVSAAAPPATPPPSARPAGAVVLPEGPGKTVVERSCGIGCHNMNTVVAMRRDRAAWSAMVESMVARGAKANEREIQLIIGYLTTHFGRN